MDDEWEELDESVMEECMVLATQLYTQPHSKVLQQDNINSGHQARPDTHRSNSDRSPCLDNNDKVQDNINASHRAQPDAHRSYSDGSHCLDSNNDAAGHSTVTNGVVDSGVCSSRGSAVNNSSRTNCSVKTFRPNQSNNSKPLIDNYSSRFSDFTATKSSMGRVPMRGKASLSQSNKAYGSLTLSGGPRASFGTSFRSSVSDSGTTNHHSSITTTTRPISPTTENGSAQQQLGKVEKERAALDEKVLMMQGEISLLRAELKRKETALESERLDKCAAIDAAEKRGKEKVTKMLSETEEKSKENVMLIDKLQGELHFKKREIGELLSRCQQLEAKCGSGGGGEELGRTAGNKRSRMELVSPFSSPSASQTKFLSRFDFGSGAARVRSVEVQTATTRPNTSRRRKLPITQSRGRSGCGVRRMALLLSSLSASPVTTTHRSSKNHGCELPSEWSHMIAQTISQSEDNKGAWQRLVEAASERLQKVHSTIVETPAEPTRYDEKCGDDDGQKWYERSVLGALEILSIGVGGAVHVDLVQIIHSLTLHLKQLFIKEQVVNNRIRLNILQTTRKVIEAVSKPMDQSICNDLVMLLRNCCEHIGSSSEVTAVLEILASLCHHHSSLSSHLCVCSGTCVVGMMCSKVRSMGDSQATETVLALLAWVMSVVRQTPPWLSSSSCSCPALLLGALTSCLHQHVLTRRRGSDDRHREVRKVVVVAAVRVMRAWSTMDPGWWERVAPLPHFPAFMALIPSIAAKTALDKHTVDQLYDLYEFDDSIFKV